MITYLKYHNNYVFLFYISCDLTSKQCTNTAFWVYICYV